MEEGGGAGGGGAGRQRRRRSGEEKQEQGQSVGPWDRGAVGHVLFVAESSNHTIIRHTGGSERPERMSVVSCHRGVPP